VNYTQSGNYKIATSNTQGCDSIFILQLQINPSYTKVESVQQCKDYTWPISGKTYNQSGNYKMELQSNKGCDSIHLLNLTIDPEIIYYDTVSAFEDYLWPVNKVLYTEGGIYQTAYKSRLGCDSLQVLVLEIKHRGQVYIPNVFTPNGDGLNDVFFPKGKGIRTIKYLRVFNRWGELVYETKDPKIGWDGKFKGNPYNAQTLVWVLQGIGADNKTYNAKGSTVLIR